MTHRPGYETTSYTGPGYEGRRETMAGRSAVDIGRPRGAAARAAGHGPNAATLAMQDEWRAELMKMKTRLLELQAS